MNINHHLSLIYLANILEIRKRQHTCVYGAFIQARFSLEVLEAHLRQGSTVIDRVLLAIHLSNNNNLLICANESGGHGHSFLSWTSFEKHIIVSPFLLFALPHLCAKSPLFLQCSKMPFDTVYRLERVFLPVGGILPIR